MSLEYKLGYFLGIGITIFISAMIILIILKKTKTDNKIKCSYDERQTLARGNAYKYGFFTLLIGNFLLGIASNNMNFTGSHIYTLLTMLCIIGIIVHVIYCIWHDAYFALNEKRKTLLRVFAIIGIINLILGIHSSSNLFCGIMFIVIFIALFAKGMKDKKIDSED